MNNFFLNTFKHKLTNKVKQNKTILTFISKYIIMTKNFGGKHFKKRKKNTNHNNREFITKNLDPDSSEQYAKILQIRCTE